VKPDPITLAWTGASGIQYGLRLLQCLLESGHPVYLLVSDAARLVIKMETDLRLPSRGRELASALAAHFQADPAQLQVFGQSEWTAPVASGSGAPRRMVVCPCTTGTLAAIAAGTSDTLIDRAADVILKERGQLILVPRETPYSQIHLENMLRLARIGATILPPNPGFYHRPQRIEDLVDFVVGRILDHLDIPHSLLPRWGQTEAPE
jgi:flavin prenyltransferase